MEYRRVDRIVEPGRFRIIGVIYPVQHHIVTMEPLRYAFARVGFCRFEPSVLFSRGTGRRSGS